MAKKLKEGNPPKPPAGRPSSLLDTRVIYCGDNWAKGLEQLAKLPVKLWLSMRWYHVLAGLNVLAQKTL